MTRDIRLTSFQKGDHICYFYRRPAEQIAVAGPFVHIGLLRGERCLCVLPRVQADKLIGWLEGAGVEPQKELARGALVVSTPEETYLAGGSFNRRMMVRFLDAAMREALEAGFTGFRGTGDLSSVAHDSGACAQMPEYEALLDRYYPGKASVGICMYDSSLFEEAHLAKVLEAHRLALLDPSPSKRAIRMRNGHAFGDVVFDRELPRLFDYAVQMDGASECFHMGQERSLIAALDAVKATLARVPKQAHA